MINTGKIKGKMVEMQITQRDVADKLEIAQSTLNLKINNRRPMNLNEAEKICELFDLKNLNMSLILWILIRILIRPCFWIHIIFLNVNFRLQFVRMNRLGHILSSC